MIFKGYIFIHIVHKEAFVHDVNEKYVRNNYAHNKRKELILLCQIRANLKSYKEKD